MNNSRVFFIGICLTAITFITFLNLQNSRTFLREYTTDDGIVNDLSVSALEQHLGTALSDGSLIQKIGVESSASMQQETETVEKRSYAERLEYYKSRYNYKPPESYKSNKARGEICGDHPSYKPYFNLPGLDQRSANNEDWTLFHNLFNATGEDNDSYAQTRGSMVELGAFNGLRESNSRFFDLCLGWDTLLIEGNPRVFETLITNRPQAHRFNFVPTCTIEEEAANKTIQFDNTIFTNGGLADGSVTTSYSNSPKEKVIVPCGHLTNVLLDIFPQGHVTMFSLDVEGSEPLVLKQIDFEKVFIEVFMIETWNGFCRRGHTCESRNEFRNIMKGAGYVMFPNVVQKSDLFIHPESRFLKRLEILS